MQKKISKNLIASIIMISVALVSFLVVMTLVVKGYAFKLDKFNVVVANNRNSFWTGFFKIFTHLGSFYTLAVLTLIGVILIWFVMKNKRLSAFYAVSFSCVCIANYLIKIIVKRVRPEHLMIINETGFSFPSGHSMMSFAFFMLLIFFVFKFIKNKPIKISLVSIFSILTIMIGFSRIYLGVHYLTDIIAGWLITFVIVSLFLMLYNTKIFKFLKDKETNNNAQNTKINK